MSPSRGADCSAPRGTVATVGPTGPTGRPVRLTPPGPYDPTRVAVTAGDPAMGAMMGGEPRHAISARHEGFPTDSVCRQG